MRTKRERKYQDLHGIIGFLAFAGGSEASPDNGRVSDQRWLQASPSTEQLIHNSDSGYQSTTVLQAAGNVPATGPRRRGHSAVPVIEFGPPQCFRMDRPAPQIRRRCWSPAVSGPGRGCIAAWLS